MSGDQEASKPPPLHQYITLPFALHIDPLPSLHYQAVPRNDRDPNGADTPNDDPDADANDGDSLALEQPHRSSIGNNLRLQPLVIQPPPHDLDTISLLISHSRATEAVPHFAALLRLLAEADEDTHFANLIEWFEGRYELGSGRLVGDETQVPTSQQDRRPGRIARMVSRGHRRSSSNAGSSTNGSGRPSFSLGQSGQILSPTAESDDMTALQEGFQQLDFSYPAGPPRTAPQLNVGSRSVTFPIRLDLHNAGRGLCPPPPPPQPPLVQPPAPAHLKASSGRRSGSDASGLRRILSPSSDRSSNDGGGSNSGFGSIDERVDRSPRRRSSTLSRLLSRRKSRRRDASNGSAASGTASGDVEPAPTPIAEDPGDSALEEDGEGSTTYDPVFLSSDEGHGSGMARDANEWAGSATKSPDFLTLLRSAAETALSLPPTPAASPSAKAKGKRAAADPSPSPGSGGDGSIFSRLARGEVVDEEEEPWYPSGGSDPLPVAILSALAPAFGWDGVMDLCYGRDSPGHNSKQLRALGMAAAQQAQAERAPSGLVGAAEEETPNSSSSSSTRTFADWQRLLDSLSRWVELYEMTRIRAGLSREIGLDALGDESSTLSLASSAPGIPPSVTQDALTLTHSYRRRMGIPEGLPAHSSAEGLIEPATYRWSRHKLGSASVATATTLTAASLAHYFTAMAGKEFVYESGWELDYLEALVLKTPIIAQRFPPPLSRAVSMVASPREGGASLHPLSCPNPRADGSVDVEAWRVWLAEQVDAGCVVTPAVSHQAWWTVIALLNAGGGRERGLGLQILGAFEDWREVRRLEGEGSVYV